MKSDMPPEFDELLARFLARAKAGDTEGLVQWLEMGGPITDEVRRATVEALRRPASRGRGRPRLLQTQQREMSIAMTAMLLEQCSMAATTANAQAAARHGSNVRSVERAKARHRKRVTDAIDYMRWALQAKARAPYMRAFLDDVLPNGWRLRDDEIRHLIGIYCRDT